MNGVATRQVLRRLAGREHVFPTNWTIVLILVLEAIVSVINIDTDAHATLSAVTEGLNAANSTEATFIAMEWLLGFCHPQVADPAMVFAKHCAAVNAQVSVEQVNNGVRISLMKYDWMDRSLMTYDAGWRTLHFLHTTSLI
jgi:hypothetical protein